jgi:hypothetical protein
MDMCGCRKIEDVVDGACSWERPVVLHPIRYLCVFSVYRLSEGQGLHSSVRCCKPRVSRSPWCCSIYCSCFLGARRFFDHASVQHGISQVCLAFSQTPGAGWRKVVGGYMLWQFWLLPGGDMLDVLLTSQPHLCRLRA